MIKYMLFFALASCATPVKKQHWEICEDVCDYSVKEACVEFLRGPGCHCEDDSIIWLDELK